MDFSNQPAIIENMNLTKPYKTLVGLATAWMLIYPLLFFIVWLFMFFGTLVFPIALESLDAPPESFPLFMFPFFAIFPLHFCTIFLMIILLVFYLIHVIKNTEADENVRIILGIGIFFLPFISMPIYYYIYIWRENPPKWAVAKDKRSE